MRLGVQVPAVLALLTLTPGPTAAQAPPATDIFVLTLRRAGDSFALGRPENVTARPGYDNQPHFSPDGRRLFYTSVRDGQADIYAVDLRSRATEPFTSTPESEYSATPMPGGREIAVIRVERDSTQRLWAFPLRGGPPRVLFEHIAPVGYQVWLDADRAGLFVLGSPATLRVASLRTGKAATVLSDIGRSVQPGTKPGTILVTHRVAEGVWWLTEIDAATAATRPVVRMPDGADYAVRLPDGSLLTAAGTTLYRWRAAGDPAWRPLAVLSAPGMGALSRLAVSPAGDRLAVVAEER
jgi:hypothetical protein